METFLKLTNIFYVQQTDMQAGLKKTERGSIKKRLFGFR